MAHDLHPLQQMDFEYCHAIAECLGLLLEQRAVDFDDGIDLVHELKTLFRCARNEPACDVGQFITDHYGPESISQIPPRPSEDAIRFARDDGYFVVRQVVQDLNHTLLEKAMGINDYVSKDIRAQLLQQNSLIPVIEAGGLYRQNSRMHRRRRASH